MGRLPFALAHSQLVGIAVWIAASAAMFAAVWTLFRLRRRPLGPVHAAIALVACALACAGLEAMVRASCERACEAAQAAASVNDSLAVDGLDACVLAAVSPFAETGVQRRARLRVRLDDRAYRDEATVRQRLALDDCDDGIDRALAFERYDDAEAQARRCGDPSALRTALALQGNLDDAEAIPTPGDLGDPALHIATGHWRAAAAVTLARAAILRTSSAHDDEPAAAILVARLEAHYDRCLAALFLHYAGEPDAAGQLRALAADRDGSVCAPIVHELAAPAERAALDAPAALDAALARDPLPASASLRSSLAWLDGATDDDLSAFSLQTPEQALGEPETTLGGPARQLWLAAIAPPTSASRLAWRAVFEVVNGNLAAASTSAATAHERAVREDPRVELAARAEESAQLRRDLVAVQHELAESLRHPADQAASVQVTAHTAALQQRVDALSARPPIDQARALTRGLAGTYDLLPALIALHTPATTIPLPPAPAADDAHRVTLASERRLVQLRIGTPPEPDSDGAAVLTAAAAGDGGPMSREGRFFSVDDTSALAVLPRVTRDRAAAIRQLVWHETPHPPRFPSRAFPYDLAIHAAARRDTLRLADQPVEAARFESIYRRLAPILIDRHRTVALMLYRR